MTPSEHKQQRDKALAQAAEIVARALPGHFGSVQINLQDGRATNVNICESLKVAQ